MCFVGRPDPSMTYFTTKKKATTVAIVRHAEKKDNSANPPLTKAGERRAESLARILKNSGISAVFSTNLERTRETVNNYADSQSPRIAIQYYNNTGQVASLIKSKYAGKSVLVPEIATALKLVKSVYSYARAKGYNPVMVTGKDANIATYKKYLTAKLKGFCSVGHGNTTGILLLRTDRLTISGLTDFQKLL